MNHISIYQIYYKQDQESFLEEAFKPYNNISNENPEWHEYWIFYQNYKKPCEAVHWLEKAVELEEKLDHPDLAKDKKYYMQVDGECED